MATNKYTIQVDERGATQATKKFGRLNTSLATTAKNIAKVGLAYFGARGLLNGAKEAIRLAGVQEQAEKRLEIALGGVSTSLLGQAKALQQVTTFGDEAIISAQALIAAFVDDEDAIKKATAATLDLAAAKGMDLNAAADLVSKTLGSSTNALSRYGIEVEGAVGSTERLDNLTSSIANKFGGQAAAAADTMTGSIDQMKNAMGDAAEEIGELLAPTVISLAKHLKSAAEALGFLLDKDKEQTDLVAEVSRLEENRLALMAELITAQNNAAHPNYIKDLQDKIDLYGNNLFAILTNIGALEAYEQVQTRNLTNTEIATEKVHEATGEMENYRASLLNVMSVLGSDSSFAQLSDNLTKASQQFKVAEGLAKAFATTSAIVDTYASANAAYLSTAKIPIVGPVLAPIAAAAAIAAGLANVAQINKAAEGMNQTVTKPTLILAGEDGAENVQITNLTKPGGGQNAPRGGITIYGDVYGYDDFRMKVAQATADNGVGYA